MGLSTSTLRKNSMASSVGRHRHSRQMSHDGPQSVIDRHRDRSALPLRMGRNVLAAPTRRVLIWETTCLCGRPRRQPKKRAPVSAAGANDQGLTARGQSPDRGDRRTKDLRPSTSQPGLITCGRSVPGPRASLSRWRGGRWGTSGRDARGPGLYRVSGVRRAPG